MVGSAPWSRAQFASKGIVALLKAAQQCPQLVLVFLWRGVLFEELAHRVEKMGVADQVEILNEKVDVNRVLARVHASVALATSSKIIRPYPHSLMESLAAGKPVLISRIIPMADDVEQKAYGEVIEHVDAAHILEAILSLRQSYLILRENAERLGKQDFGHSQMLASLGKVYEHVLGITPPG
jgi:glycosyltransferase involved in cell wall biosynthesis